MIKKRTFVVTITAVVAIAGASAVGFAATDATGTGAASRYCAEMPDSVGLYAGNPVTQMGFEVGRVEDIESKGDRVQVTFVIDADRRFPADVKAVTRSKSLLADRSLELVGNYQQGPQLNAGQCIPLTQAFTPKSISEITGSAADFIDALSPGDGSQSFEAAVAGFQDAMNGNGEQSGAMMQHASEAMSSPNQLVADIGSIIMNMAPLTDEALQKWSTIRSILDQMPEIVAAGSELWPGAVKVIHGVAWLVATLYEIQGNYGDLIWPMMNGGVTDLIHLAAGRSEDIAGLIETIPSVATALRQQSASPGGLTVNYQPPVQLLDLILAKGK